MIPLYEHVQNIKITFAHQKLPGEAKTDSGPIHPFVNTPSAKQTVEKQIHPAAKFERKNRQQCLERILWQLQQSDLPEKVLVEQYFRHKYRNNCKGVTLQSAYTTIKQFLSFMQQEGKTNFSDLNHRDVEAFIEAMQNGV